MEGFTQELIQESPEGGRVYRQHFVAGTRLPVHDHKVGEHVVLLKGRIRIGSAELAMGAHLWTPPGVRHDAMALEETVLIVIEPPRMS